MTPMSEARRQQVHGKLQPMQVRTPRLVDQYRSMQAEAREPVILTDDPNDACSHLAERQPNWWLGFALITAAAAVLFAALIMFPAASQPSSQADGTTSPASIEAAAGDTGVRL